MAVLSPRELKVSIPSCPPILHRLAAGPFESQSHIFSLQASWFEQFRALMWRSWLSTIKEPMLIQVRFFQAIVRNRLSPIYPENLNQRLIHFQLLGLVLGTLYFGQELTQEGVQNINGGIFLILSSLTFSTANGVINVSLVRFILCQEDRRRLP